MMNEAPISDDSDNEELVRALNYHFSSPTLSHHSSANSTRRTRQSSDDELADPMTLSSPSMSPLLTSNQLPLIPSDCDNVQEAHENFLRVFEARYGDKHPLFNPISLLDALQDLQSSHYSVRKPILLYLHDDNSVLSQIFCTQVLCSQTMIDFINSNFFLWAWDFTVAENRTKVIDWVETLLGPQRSLQIRVCTTEDFPVLAVLGKVAGGVEIAAMVKGAYLIDQAMMQLMNALDICQAFQKTEAVEDEARQKREQVKNEQDHAYNESLQADKLKAELKLKEEKRVKEEERLKTEADKQKEENRQLIESSLEAEPAENCAKPITRIRIRTINGQNLERRFLRAQPLSHLFDFVASKNFSTSDFKLLTNYPKKDLTSIDSKKTFAELNFGPREVIVMEAR